MGDTVDAPTAQVLVTEGACLLDVREDGEWAAGHAPGALHIPLGELRARIGGIPREGRIVTVCKVGGRSRRAQEALLGDGFDAVNLEGGMEAWHQAGLPVVDEHGKPGRVL